MRFEVSDEVAREITRLSGILDLTEDKLLRRLLKLSAEKDEIHPAVSRVASSRFKGLIARDGTLLPLGLKLQRIYRGKEYTAVVKDGAIFVDGISRRFTSPSWAAVEITGRNVNGWRFWRFYDEKGKRWRPLFELRN